MTKLPESKNPNLPRPPAAPPAMRPIPGPPPPGEPRPGPSLARSVLAMVLIGGGFAAGIYYYVRGVQHSVEVEESMTKQLTAVGDELWKNSTSDLLLAADDEAGKDLDDLPRIIAAVKARSLREDSLLKLEVFEGDPPPGKYTATHQLRYLFNGDAYLVVRLRVEKDGLFYFVGEANRVTPSRIAWEKGEREVPAKDALPPVVDKRKNLPPATGPALPAGVPPGVDPFKPFNPDAPPTVTPPPVSAVPPVAPKAVPVPEPETPAPAAPAGPR